MIHYFSHDAARESGPVGSLYVFGFTDPDIAEWLLVWTPPIPLAVRSAPRALDTPIDSSGTRGFATYAPTLHGSLIEARAAWRNLMRRVAGYYNSVESHVYTSTTAYSSGLVTLGVYSCTRMIPFSGQPRLGPEPPWADLPEPEEGDALPPTTTTAYDHLGG